MNKQTFFESSQLVDILRANELSSASLADVIKKMWTDNKKVNQVMLNWCSFACPLTRLCMCVCVCVCMSAC